MNILFLLKYDMFYENKGRCFICMILFTSSSSYISIWFMGKSCSVSDVDVDASAYARACKMIK